MRFHFTPIVLSILLCASAAQAGDSAVDATIRQFAVAFNRGDIGAVKALHVAAPTIIDEVAPHFWTGPNAFDSWLADLGKSEAADGKTNGVVTLSAPTRETVSDGSAYVIVPATYSFIQKHVALREIAQMTFVLTRQAKLWKILCWTWTGAEGIPAPGK